MSRWMSLLFVMASACGPWREPLSQPLDFDTVATELAAQVRKHMRTEKPRRTVHVYVPEGVDAEGSHVPLLYLEEGRALFFPDGAASTARAVVPRPSELIALGQRRDIVIIAVDPEPSADAVTLSDGRTRYITHVAMSPPPT
ncbi:hypothetical protein JY651_32740 [Pyxidicoccus parkwayensis]|uniref:Lipoprotein n=1 Tax=Pyxidicoccus parkwayensis TaxID=2813578 RepID=A0ABX7NMF2_9BACT|nr:hypothetical protein [Pyxidicoccus parkwaysis]QSQ20024.1 hypothetical protein JY651_32740 [Pyxidicoccus parkwaysis]